MSNQWPFRNSGNMSAEEEWFRNLRPSERLRMDMLIDQYRPTREGLFGWPVADDLVWRGGASPIVPLGRSPLGAPDCIELLAAQSSAHSIAPQDGVVASRDSSEDVDWSAVPSQTLEAMREAVNRLNQLYSGTDPDTGQRVAPQHERRTDVPLRPAPIPGSAAPPQFPEWPMPGHSSLNQADKAGEGDGTFGSLRNTKNGTSTHGGIDIQAPAGSPVIAAQSGIVIDIRPNPSDTYGRQVVIDHGNGYYSQSAHLEGIQVKPGEKISAGQLIGSVGRTGNLPQNGDSHLHFEIREGSYKLRAATGGARLIDPQQILPRPYFGR
jgi:murein DD-endopeptidase MepM/ murein hydrolase activator NlpD